MFLFSAFKHFPVGVNYRYKTVNFYDFFKSIENINKCLCVWGCPCVCVSVWTPALSLFSSANKNVLLVSFDLQTFQLFN